MKKRVVAIVLSLCMCLLTGAEATITGAADFSSEETVSGTESETAEPEAAGEENAPEDSSESETAGTEETVSEQKTSGETDETAPEQETSEETAADSETSVETEEIKIDIENESGAETEAPEQADSEEETTEVIFDDGSDAEAAGEAPAAEEESLDSAEASSDFEAFESTNKLLYTRWQYDSSVGKWKLKKYSASSADTSDSTEYYTSSDGLVTITTYLSSDGTTSMSGTYAFDASGYLLTGSQSVGGKSYYFKTSSDVSVDSDKTNVDPAYSSAPAPFNSLLGQMAKSEWCLMTIDGTKYYRYFDENGVYVEKAKGAYSINNKTYLLNAGGALVINKPFILSDGTQYFSDENGEARCSQLVSYNGYKYYYGSDGKRVSWKNCWKRIASSGNDYYYFGSVAGRVQVKSGWQKITVSGKYKGWYYFTKKGKMWKSKWNSKKTLYFKSDGSLASGLTKIGSDYYFFRKSTASKRRGAVYKSAWIKDTKNKKSVIYRARKNGKLYKEAWIKVGGYYYYIKNYKLVTSKTGLYNTKKKEWGAVESDGKFKNGWVVMNDSQNKVTYISKTDGKIPKGKVVTIDGKEYRFDSKGYRVNDRTSEAAYKNRSSYYLVCDRANGVMTVYTDSTMKVPVKTIRVSVGNPVTLTRLGTYTLTKAGRWQELMGPSYGQYATHVTGGIYVHSVACTYANSYNLPVAEYLKLGSPASHGCIRCCVADAKWVWDHCNGSKITIIQGTYVSQNGLKGPLGRNPITPLRGSKNFDPTDPACS